jgi:hypothetical protein
LAFSIHAATAVLVGSVSSNWTGLKISLSAYVTSQAMIRSVLKFQSAANGYQTVTKTVITIGRQKRQGLTSL